MNNSDVLREADTAYLYQQEKAVFHKNMGIKDLMKVLYNQTIKESTF